MPRTYRFGITGDPETFIDRCKQVTRENKAVIAVKGTYP